MILRSTVNLNDVFGDREVFTKTELAHHSIVGRTLWNLIDYGLLESVPGYPFHFRLPGSIASPEFDLPEVISLTP
jgi:hypothetical protein